MDNTKIVICNCEHSSQDKIHGKNKRLANKINKTPNKTEYRCTVCGKIH